MSSIKFSTSSENISSNGGFSFVYALLNSIPAMKHWDSQFPSYCNAKFSLGALVRSFIAMLAAGCCNFVDIEKLEDDALFKLIVGDAIPSQESLRQRLDSLATKEYNGIIDDAVAFLLRKAPLGEIQVAGMNLIPIDIDVSVLKDSSSHKEGVAMSYHKVNGYAPIFCYVGTQGYMVANELRPGNQHSENGAVEFLERCVKIMLKAGYSASQLLLRVDSGHDSSDFIRKAEELGLRYIIKRNQRRECEMQLIDSIRSYEDAECVRPGKMIYRGFRSDKKPAEYPSFRGFMAIEATVRTILANGQYLLGAGEVDLSSYWTNMPCSVMECVQLYHDHATSEQFHSEFKSDMGIELLPSGKMATNALILGLASIAFNILRFIGDAGLTTPEKEDDPKRMRLRKVLLFFIKIGCKVVNHANTLWLKVSRDFAYFDSLRRIEACC